MKKKLGIALGALVLVSGVALAAGGAGMVGCDGEGYGKHRMQGEDGKNHGPNPGRVLEHLDRSLSLSDEQRQQVGALMEAKQAKRGGDKAKIQDHRASLRALDPASPSYLDEVEELANNRADAMASRMLELAKVHAEIYALLTPEQQVKFKEQQQKGDRRHHRR